MLLLSKVTLAADYSVQDIEQFFNDGETLFKTVIAEEVWQKKQAYLIQNEEIKKIKNHSHFIEIKKFDSVRDLFFVQKTKDQYCKYQVKYLTVYDAGSPDEFDQIPNYEIETHLPFCLERSVETNNNSRMEVIFDIDDAGRKIEFKHQSKPVDQTLVLKQITLKNGNTALLTKQVLPQSNATIYTLYEKSYFLSLNSVIHRSSKK